MVLEVRGPLTVSELMLPHIDDGGGLAMVSASSFVFHQHCSDRDLFAVLIDAPLDRRRLMDVLFAVAPYKAHGPDRISRVLDNWALFDRARASSASERLLVEHERSLGSSWQEFQRHSEVFASVLADQSGQRSLTPLLVWSRAEDGRRRWEFASPGEELAQAVENAREGLPGEELDTLAGLITIPYLMPELSKHWPAWQPLTKGGKSNYIGPASVPVMALRHRRALLNSAVIRRAEAYAANPTP